MVKNYLKIAFRNMLRHKLYTLINIIGLTIGITSSCLIFMYVNDELSYDAFHDKADRIYRIVEVHTSVEPARYYGQTAPAVGPALAKDFPQVINQTKINQPWGHIDIIWEGQRLSERGWLIGDQHFFELFDFEFIEGSPETALNEPNQVVITNELAKKYFGNTNALGQVMNFNTLEPIKVSGVIKAIPTNSHIQFDLMLSRNTFFREWENYNQSWDDYGAYTYVLLDKNNDIKSVEEVIPTFVEQYLGDNPQKRNFRLQPLREVYLDSENVEFGISGIKGDSYYVYIFLAIGIFILLIACINYINLATAKSMQRAKEIGLRKVSGAGRGQLIVQFLCESMLITFIAFMFSVGLTDLLMPFFNQLSGKSLVFSDELPGRNLQLLFITTLFIGLVSGSFPAFYLSKLKPTDTLKGEVRTSVGNLKLRQILVIVQFTLSIIMIVSTVVVSHQMNYIKNKKMGFNFEGMLVVDINNGNVRRSFQAMKSEFAKVPGVQTVAVSSRVPGEWKNIVEVFVKGGRRLQPDDSVQSFFMGFDKDMLATYDMQLVSGSNFSGNEGSDSTNVLVNETAVELFGWDDPIGEEFEIGNVPYKFKVIGVVKDYHFQSLHQKIGPLIMGYRINPVRVIDYFSIKIDSRNISEAIASVTAVHEKFDDATPIEYHFLENQLANFYQNDLRAGRLFAIGAGLTIFIACLGLFGLASFVIQRRTKEIGLRKALGASVTSLLLLLIKSFTSQVIISFVIATPVAYLLMKKWLGFFTYKIGLGAGNFLLAGIITLAIAILTVSYRAFKTSMVNPADTLKRE